VNIEPAGGGWWVLVALIWMILGGLCGWAIAEE
jgi:hypothetical protein